MGTRQNLAGEAEERKSVYMGGIQIREGGPNPLVKVNPRRSTFASEFGPGGSVAKHANSGLPGVHANPGHTRPFPRLTNNTKQYNKKIIQYKLN